MRTLRARRRSTRQVSAAAVATFVGAALVSVGGPAAAVAAPAGPPTRTVAFDTPGEFHWKVPAGVFSATFDLTGAAGGGSTGGSGAHVVATIPVKPGTVLTVVVGGHGSEATGHPGGAGGFGGGAAGGAGADELPLGAGFSLPGGPGGAGGGGATDVRTGDGTDLASRLVVAGGGGGAGQLAGGASGLVGQPGTDGAIIPNFPIFPPQVVPGGGGASATAGGAGGGGAGSGSTGLGGVGAVAPPDSFQVVAGRPGGTFGGQGGGGGGGGLFGGGGGASAADSAVSIFQFQGTSAGGGGGSSLVPTDALCPTIAEVGTGHGDGAVAITFHVGNAGPFLCP
jgi:hypothetical protein